jgi:hypothetical protein
VLLLSKQVYVAWEPAVQIVLNAHLRQMISHGAGLVATRQVQSGTHVPYGSCEL